MADGERRPRPSAPPGGRPRIRVGLARTMAEFEAVSDLQATIWDSWKVAAPAALLKAISEAGGLVLLARQGAEPVGFAFGFTGRDPDGRLYHRSHAAGVLPGFRDLGLGRSLKLAQRRAARNQGLDRMVWTFDPLQFRNAHFNLHRLGAVARSFHRNYYGTREDLLNRGRPTDRLVVEWFLGADQQRALVAVRRGAARHPARLVRVPAVPDAGVALDPARLRELRVGLAAALREGLAVVDFDRRAGAYRCAPLPSWFPPKAE